MTRRDVRYDVVVIGAGAAGMMCAATSGLRQRRVLLIEHYPVLGEKIRISGGGRCNFTNINAGPANFLSHNPDFCKSALARYTPRDFLALVERYRIGYHEKKLGQLFCDDTARDLIAMLKAECDRGNVEWRMPCSVDAISREDRAWRIATPLGAVCCDSIVVATGGLTVPKIGATPFGYRIAEQFGLAVVAPSPALVPLALPPDALARYGDLAGVAVDVEVADGLAVEANRDLLEQALRNLGENAAKHTARGSVVLRAYGNGNTVTVEVEDSGPGINPEVQRHVFDRFYRGERDAHGFGLGLAIVRESVRTLGARIELDSSPGEGTVFRILLAPARVREEVPTA